MADMHYSIESKPVGFIRFEKQLVIAGMNNVITGFYMKGKKNYALTMPC